MSDSISNSKRIAKNTMALYFRMIITLIVGLFTSRVILDSLGVEDYGIYNLVGGFVAMFSIFRAGLLSAVQRFITYDLGLGDIRAVRSTFSTSMIIFISLSVLVVVIAEFLGIWFIENKLTIPDERLVAAHWVFQFSLITFVLNLISFPYNALIIAHEHMKAFAYISIYEVFAKLILSYLVYISPFDRLIFYSVLMCIIQFTERMIYGVYCKKHFEESKFDWKIEWNKIKKIYAFTGWELFGSVAVIGYTQGLNILLGMFFTPVVNAARGVAVQAQSVISGFVTNFQTALNPQITKSYAANNNEYMSKLVFTSSRVSFFLLFFFALPIILETDTLLDIWLVDVPDYTVVFFRLIIITTMVDAISNPIITAVEATGDIKVYQLIVGGILLMILPVSYVVLRVGGAPYSVFIVHIVFAIIAFCARLIMASRVTGLSKRLFLKEVILVISLVVVVSSVAPVLSHFVLENDMTRLVVVVFVSMLSTAAAIYCIGLKQEERQFINSKIKSILKRG